MDYATTRSVQQTCGDMIKNVVQKETKKADASASAIFARSYFILPSCRNRHRTHTLGYFLFTEVSEPSHLSSKNTGFNFNTHSFTRVTKIQVLWWFPPACTVQVHMFPIRIFYKTFDCLQIHGSTTHAHSVNVLQSDADICLERLLPVLNLTCLSTKNIAVLMVIVADFTGKVNQ